MPLPYVDYIHDRGTARASGLAMARTMRILYDYIDSLPQPELCRQPLHLICHSMGGLVARAVIEAASEASTGRAYVNYLGDADAARTSYGAETYSRLARLKERYDPTNVFRRNQNIEPSGATER